MRRSSSTLARAALAAALGSAFILQTASSAGASERPSPLPAVLAAVAAQQTPAQRPLRRVQDASVASSALSPEVQQSLGCAVTGAAATALAVAAGGENLVNVIAGGVVVPSNRTVLYIGLVGVVFASFCAIGQALTPLYLYAVDTPVEPAFDAVRGAVLPPVHAYPAVLSIGGGHALTR